MVNDFDDKLQKKFQKDEDRRKKPADYYDEEEETYMYDVKKPMAFINEGEHGVFDITKQTGLNSAKSVFDKGATFKTST